MLWYPVHRDDQVYLPMASGRPKCLWAETFFLTFCCPSFSVGVFFGVFLKNSMFIGFSSFSACSLCFFCEFLECLRLWLICACLVAKFLAFFPVAINPCHAFFVDQWHMQLSLHFFVSCFCDVPDFLFDFQDASFHLILFRFACRFRVSRDSILYHVQSLSFHHRLVGFCSCLILSSWDCCVRNALLKI